jgi:hypothetical protein
METKARLDVPRALQEAGVDAEGWAGLAQAAVDLVFRDSLAINIADGWMVRSVAPRWGRLQAIASPGIAPEDRLPGSRPWPGAVPNPANPSRLILLIYRLIGGSAENRIDQDRAREVLDALWALITTTAARDCGRGTRRLDLTKAAVARVDKGWFCPITRRNLAYTTGASVSGKTAGRLGRLPVRSRLTRKRRRMASWPWVMPYRLHIHEKELVPGSRSSRKGDERDKTVFRQGCSRYRW